jgi:hypothetical protein
MNPTKISRTRKGLVWMAAGAAAFGVGLGAASIASAASDTSSSTTVAATNTAAATAGSTAAAATTPVVPQVDPASLPNGPGETVLTGDTLAKVTAAAQAADPGATLIRAETDSSGHAYEAHMKNADGTVTTLYFTSTFAADGQDTGFGPGGPGHGGPGHGGPQGQPPVQPSTSGSTTGA